MRPSTLPKPQTLREQLDALHAVNVGGDPAEKARFDRLVEVPYRGRPLGDHVRDNNSKHYREVHDFANLAVATDMDAEIVDIENCVEPDPDLGVTLTGDREVYVEVSQVTAPASARAWSEMEAINLELQRRYESDPAYAAALQGRRMHFIFPNFPTKREARAIPDEIIAIFYAADVASMKQAVSLRPYPAVAPILSKLRAGCNITIGGRYMGIVVTKDAHAFDPNESANDFHERLREKMNKTYTSGRPIWLVLILDDRMQAAALSMNAIRARLPTDIGQFDRLLFGSLLDAEMIVKA